MPEATRTRASLGRRVIALAIDWAIAMAISAGFLDNHALATIGVFAVMRWLLLATRGASIGHTVVGVRVRTLAGNAATPLQVLIRTVSQSLVVPAVVWGLDGRGLHDAWAGTDVVRRP